MGLQEEPLITPITFISLLAVVALILVAHFLGNAVLPAKTRRFDRFVFDWLVRSGSPPYRTSLPFC